MFPSKITPEQFFTGSIHPISELEWRSVKTSPFADAYFRFLRLSAAVAALPAFEELDANHRSLLEAVALRWSTGTPMSVREAIHLVDLGSPATLHKRLQRLIKQDLFSAQSHDGDRRTKYLAPSTKGLDYFHQMGKQLQYALNKA